MRNGSLRRGFFVLALCASTSAMAQQAPVADLGFRLGDPVGAVKAALKVDYEPEAMEPTIVLPAAAADMNKGKTFYHLRSRGVWAFFSPAGKLETIRLDAPFKGVVSGVRLGDSLATVKAKLGEPIMKPTTYMSMQSYKYVLDDSAYVTLQLNGDGVQTIYITK